MLVKSKKTKKSKLPEELRQIKEELATFQELKADVAAIKETLETKTLINPQSSNARWSTKIWVL